MSKTIALVDDDRNILTSVTMALEAEGFNVRTYKDGAEALDAMTTRPPDLAILDIKMPRMDGMELLGRLRRKLRSRKLKVLLLCDEVEELIQLKDQDPAHVAMVQKNSSIYAMPVSRRISNKEVNWSIIAAPSVAWATKVFPDLDGDAAVAALWESIFRICRVDQDDPIGAWQTHIAALKLRREALDAKQYRSLRYRAPGTELELGLPDDHRWMGGESRSKTDTLFVANMPTEEVFTLPHRDRADGLVSSSKPLSYAGTLIEEFSLRFEAGRVVEVKAGKGEATLRKLVETDEGAGRLGEVALVPHGSPISQSGLLFLNTLYDENASSHLAVGRAYRICLEGGAEMSDENFLAAGGNDSLVHVDFMIGSELMDVDGVLDDGRVEPVMRKGEWAFEI